MPTKDLHEKPFDRATLTKLKLFEEYAKAWIPTFVMQGYREIYIFDFFAGTGRDKSGEWGSPIRILRQVGNQLSNIQGKGVTAYLIFNEYDEEKKVLLQEAIAEFLNFDENQELKKVVAEEKVKIKVQSRTIEEIFSEYYPKMLNIPSLVYMDQNGVKFLTLDYLGKFEECAFIDVLYFISSSHYQRFCRRPEFRNLNLPIDTENVKKASRGRVHEVLVDEIRKILPSSACMSLYPFSLKKDNGNVHGVIFGAKHPRAVDKFLHATWKLNEQNGSANYDIEEEFKNVQQEFDFSATGDVFVKKKMSKIEKFQEVLKGEVLVGKIKNNRDAYFFTLTNGHIPAHARAMLLDMRTKKLIDFEGRSPSVTYLAACGDINERKTVEFKVV